MEKNRIPHSLRLDPSRLLGGLTASEFLRDYWQKKPLLVRQALPGFGTGDFQPLDAAGLKRLACQEDAESRLVRHIGERWAVEYGPFAAERLERLPKRNWSLLVSGVNLLLPFGDQLLQAFGFMPQARLDDLMVSYAPDGGGVGPHFDSYDVFLLQGSGRRRWEISGQDDLELVEGSPLRILRRFRVDQSWELEPGDLLYLPPKYAHNGVALGSCMTWSVGFRAPGAQEIATAFLDYLRDKLELAGIYADPRLTPPRHGAELTPDMLGQLEGMIDRIRWSRSDTRDFLGQYLSEPKPHIYFDPPARPLGRTAFDRRVLQDGIRLDPRSRLLFLAGGAFFINGESLNPPKGCRTLLTRLADRRYLASRTWPESLLDLLFQWYRQGYVWPGPAPL